MERNTAKYQFCQKLLREELIPALGCTEPTCVAYASAKAREVLGCRPEKMQVLCSGNIIKNVKAVTVPTTQNLKGIPAAAVLGMVAGDASLELEVLRNVTPDDVAVAKELLNAGICEAGKLDTRAKLHVVVKMTCGEHSSLIEILHAHNNIVRIEKDGVVLHHSEASAEDEVDTVSLPITSADVFEFAHTAALEDLSELLDKQMEYNWAISQEGLRNRYGAQVGRRLLAQYGENPFVLAEASAAAGSDARMSGCEMPVVINSGSGNQGITVAVPIISMAHSLGSSREQLLRALCLGNLIALYQKAQIGRLSAYCGAITASSGAAAGMAMLMGESDEVIGNAIINTLAIASGIVCDGAKPSCAAKISAGIHAANLGVQMARDHNNFENGEGLVKDGLENTINCIGTLAHEGMRETDDLILTLMMQP